MGWSWIGAIIIGGVAGWIAEKLMSSDMPLIANIGLGIVGGLIGAWIATQFGFATATYGVVGQLVIATIGACLLIWLGRLIRGRRGA